MMKPSTSSSTSTEHGVGTNSEPKYKGVRKRKWGKWVSEIRLPNSRERIWLGSYDSAEKAARAFDAALFCLRGRNAKFNFPQNPPEIAGGRSMSAQEIQEAAARFANEEVPRRSSNLSNSHNAAAAEQNSSSTPSSVVSDQAVVQVDTEVMDWSFLNMLDCNEGVSNYGLYDGLLGYMPGELYAPPSHQPQLDDNLDGQTGGETAFSSHSSFLWNF